MPSTVEYREALFAMMLIYAQLLNMEEPCETE